MLFISGVLFGKFSHYLSYFGQAVETVSDINPHGILMIFLPILIFESGFNADWHIFKKQFGQTFILAFPCVFVGSLLIMLSIKLVLQYDDVIKRHISGLLHMGWCLYVRQHSLMYRYSCGVSAAQINRRTKKI
jgi:NhaP-type Na+/H+ or K+/H+ antiporter